MCIQIGVGTTGAALTAREAAAMFITAAKKHLTAIAFAAVGVASLASTASAGDWRYRYPDYGYAPRYGYHAPVPRYDYGPPPVHHRHHRRDRTGDAVAGAILGLGAVIVGAAIVDAARQERRRTYGY